MADDRPGTTAGTAPRVAIFAPSPILTVTVEEHASGDEVHVHAGGQGVWQARMLRRLGVDVTMCCAFSGEAGRMLRHLLADEGFALAGIDRDGVGAAYVHDRRGGERVTVAEVHGDRLGRHDLDELYGDVLREGLEAGIVILSGPSGDDALPADTYRRLASDLRAGGATVLVDLAGERMTAAIEGGVDVLKVSHEELRRDGLTETGSAEEIRRAMLELRERGARAVIVTRAGDPFWLLDDDGVIEVAPPQLEVADHRGAGDSLTAGTAAGLARGEPIREAVVLGAAAGALNVTRHGLGTGDPETIELLRSQVRSSTPPDDPDGGVQQRVTGRVSPDGLAELARPGQDS